MKKKIFATLTGGLAAVMMTSCASLKEIVDYVQYPQEYLVEYEITNEDDTITYLTKGMDAEGNYYYKDADSEEVFVKNGDVYTVYANAEGAWQQTGTVNADYIKTNTEEFTAYAEKGREQFNGAFKQGESKTYLETSCETYALTINLALYKQEYEMLVDSATKICLSYRSISKVNGNETDSEGFKATKFQTSEVDVLGYME